MHARSQFEPTSTLTQQPYHWQNVAIGSGGRITGIVAHPADPDVLYIRTDVGGAYRWTGSQWQQVLDWIPREHANWYGVESLALDPNDPAKLYIAAGAYPWLDDQAILISDQFGAQGSWRAVPVPFTMAANFADPNSRWCGERLAVDPHDSRVLYFASHQNGLWRSGDGGQQWHMVDFPTNGTNVFHPSYEQGTGAGLAFVLFDPNGGRTAEGRCRVIYVGVSGDTSGGLPVEGTGAYRSDDGGDTWRSLPGWDAAQSPMRGAVTTKGVLYVTCQSNWTQPNGSVKKYSAGAWHDITPQSNVNYVGLSTDPQQPETLMVSEYCIGQCRLFRSTDGGTTWHPEIGAAAQVDMRPLPWFDEIVCHQPEYRFSSFALTSTVLLNGSVCWLVDGWSAWRCDDIYAVERGESSRWTAAPHGIEEVFAFELRSPAAGDAVLLTALADMDGFRHTDLDRYPPRIHGEPRLRNTSGLDFAPAHPQFVVRVGETWDQTVPHYGAYSLDEGITWTPFTASPFVGGKPAHSGKIAVSADGQRIVWLPVNGGLFTSVDRGTSWRAAQGTPERCLISVWQNHSPLAADRVNPNCFYLYHAGSLYRSDDGADTFTLTPAQLPRIEPDTRWGLPSMGTDRSVHLKAAPHAEGELWLSLDDAGLWLSRDGGVTFTAVEDVTQAVVFGFGVPAKGNNAPAFYMYGTVRGIAGVFRSDDLTAHPAHAHWTQIDVSPIRMGAFTSCMEGDGRVYGRVYIGTYGRGVFVGTPPEQEVNPVE
ncbi:MAG: hypothetical protein IAE80_12955 [Anaerolinea sp.]|nr:hypothetical protein [Anaerolinea sp.]